MVLYSAGFLLVGFILLLISTIVSFVYILEVAHGGMDFKPWPFFAWWTLLLLIGFVWPIASYSEAEFATVRTEVKVVDWEGAKYMVEDDDHHNKKMVNLNEKMGCQIEEGDRVYEVKEAYSYNLGMWNYRPSYLELNPNVK